MKEKVRTLQTTPDERTLKACMLEANIPYKYWRDSLLEKRNSKFGVTVDFLQRQSKETQRGLTFITGIEKRKPVSYNEYRRVYMMYARDLRMAIKEKVLAVSLQELMTYEHESGNTYYIDYVRSKGWPKHVFLDGFWDVSINVRSFPEPDAVKARYIQFVRRLIEDGFFIYPFCYQQLSPAASWYSQSIVYEIQEATDAFTI